MHGDVLASQVLEVDGDMCAVVLVVLIMPPHIPIGHHQGQGRVKGNARMYLM